MKAEFVIERKLDTNNDTGKTVHLLAVSGEIDASNATQFEDAVREQAPAPEALVLDFNDVAYCDSAGFSMLDRLVGTQRAAIVLDDHKPAARAAGLLGLPTFSSWEFALRAVT